MLLLFGIHSLKTFVHHPLLPHLERSSKPISTQKLLHGADLFLSLDFEFCILLLSQWRLSAIKVKLELELWDIRAELGLKCRDLEDR